MTGPDFVTRREDPAPGVLGEYGFGYTFLRYEADPSQFAYGPGRFAYGFQLITFRVLDSGETFVRMAFVINRPESILNMALDPVAWGFRLADFASLGLASRLFAPTRWVLDRLPLRVEGFDPVTTYIALANLVTAGWAAKELCLSRVQLEKDFLLQHFMQHYQMMVGSLLTWRRVPDWRATDLPTFVTSGVSS